MEKGDLTVLVPEGDNLSGGQKARINLARALYHEADLYIFDDPLSACDENVAACILARMLEGLLRNRAVVMLLSSDKFVDCFEHRLTLVDVPNRETSVLQLSDQHPRRPRFRHLEEAAVGSPLRPKKNKLPVEPDTVLATYGKYIKESGNVFHWVVVLLLFICCEIMFSIYVWNLSKLHDEIE